MTSHADVGYGGGIAEMWAPCRWSPMTHGLSPYTRSWMKV